MEMDAAVKDDAAIVTALKPKIISYNINSLYF